MHERETFSCLTNFNTTVHEKYGNTGYGVIGSIINILNLCLKLICMSPSPYLSALDFWLFLVWNIECDELDVLCNSGSKYPVQSRKKSNSKFQTGECQ